MDDYRSAKLAGINSQVNEQANAGLQRIKSQLAYMNPKNFKFTLSLFLSITNLDKIRKIDIQHLSVDYLHILFTQIINYQHLPQFVCNTKNGIYNHLPELA